MAATPGTFTPSDNYADLKLAHENMFSDPSLIGKEFNTPIETVLALRENSNYRIEDNSPLKSAFSSQTVTVWYPELCSVTIDDHTDAAAATCAIDGDEMGTDSKSYDKNYDKSISCEVREDRKNNLFDTAAEIAYQIELAKRKLEEDFNSTVISTIDSNFNASNDFGDLASGAYDTGTGIITYDPATWTADLIAEFDLMAQVNQINSPIFLHGTNLYQEVFLAANKACCDNEGDRNLFGQFGHYWDPRSFISSFTTSTKPSYMVQPNSVVYWNAYQYENDAPQNQMDSRNTHTWREPSERLTNVDGSPFYFDIEWQRDCTMVNNGDANASFRRNVHQIRVILRGGIDVAPTQCSQGTGIYKFLNA